MPRRSAIVFNIGQLILSACAGGWAYVLLGGRILQVRPGYFVPLTAHDFPAALYGMMGAAAVYALVNLALVSIGYGLYKKVSPWEVARSAVPVLPAHLTLPFVGFLMAQVLAISVIALPLFVFPLVVARQLYLRYLKLRDAYADTVRSLVGALEEKDPYTRGHSERVASYAMAIGRAVGLDAASRAA